jgi:hypothetical protein
MGAVSAKPSAMELVRNLLKRVAREKRPIVLVGEPGVGKRFFAKTLHRLSGRGGRFEVLDCRNADLGEAAMQMIRSAGGTFLIEEILELPRGWRASLLAMLQMLSAAVDSPPDATEQSNLCCSFCEKGAAETRHLIGVVPPPLLKAWQGDVAICDACLDICDDIIAQGLTGQEDAQPTITFRAAHPPERVESALAEADALLARHKACNVVVFLDGAAERAAAVLEQTKRALRARAELWERQSAQPPAAVLFALPPPDPSWEDR